MYVFDEEEFLRNYRRFDQCFKNAYENYRISYSFKTNYAPYICKLVLQNGGYAEVVSDMELQIAKKVGFSNHQIVYNGPCKGPLAEEHILNGGILNIDCFEELNRIREFAVNNPQSTLKIGIRVNIDIEQGFVSRFGIDETDLRTVFTAIKGNTNIEIVGLHCHIGRSRSLDAWKKRIDRMLRVADMFFSSGPEYISLGSGMYGEMEPSLAEQFDRVIPSYEQYAEAVAKPMAEHYSFGEKPILFTEPGTTLINKYVSFISTVKSIKKIKNKIFVGLDGSKHNIGEICQLKQLPIQVIHFGNEKNIVTNADFVGYTCLEHDVLYKNFSGDIRVGDMVIFGNVGGYSNVSKPPFINANCAMVSNTGRTIKRAETVEEVICTYE